METLKHDLRETSKHFALTGKFLEAKPYGSGHINDTYLVQLEIDGVKTPFIYQRINHLIFKNPPALMDNIVRVTKHIQSKLVSRGKDPKLESLIVINASDNIPYYQDKDGNYWRMYHFIMGSQTYDVLTNNDQAYQAAKAFGFFQKDLSDIGGERLHETIVNFHHTASRFATLEEAIAEDKVGRKKECLAEIEFALQRKDFCSIVVDGLADGSIPERITHNDTKINNVMLDTKSGEARAVIDLDTVMPGSALYDFGDLIRTSIAETAEDETNLSLIIAKMDRFECLIQGFLEGAGDCLNSREIELLPMSGRLITFECGIRFLTDYLNGDTYFKTHRPNQNLDRTRSQFQLVKSMEEQEKTMNTIMKKYL